MDAFIMVPPLACRKAAQPSRLAHSASNRSQRPTARPPAHRFMISEWGVPGAASARARPNSSDTNLLKPLGARCLAGEPSGVNLPGGGGVEAGPVFPWTCCAPGSERHLGSAREHGRKDLPAHAYTHACMHGPSGGVPPSIWCWLAAGTRRGAG